MSPVLEVRDLWTEFKRPGGVVHAVNGVNFDVEPGESLGILGESGSGKSVSVLSILGLISKNGRILKGEALLDNRDLLALNSKEMLAVRGKDVGVIFQDPMTSLNPIMRIGPQIMEGMLVHHLCSKAEAKQRAIQLLKRVGIPNAEERFNDYPYQFSGGMRQRVMIAIALSCHPKLLIADEPTTALDVTVQAQVLDLLDELRQETGMAMILITHDFGVATNHCDRIVVMYAGEVVETAPVERILLGPAHPYTLGLLESTLEIGHGKKPLTPIPGVSASPLQLYQGCPFAPRCRFATEKCVEVRPALREISGPDHRAACHYAEEVMAYAEAQR